MNSQVKSISSARSLAAMDIPAVSVDGYEADDVIATLAWQAKTAGFEVLVLTGDRDCFNWSTTPARFYIRSAGSRTCRGWTQPRSRHVSVCRRRSIPTTLLCAVTRRTICPEPGVGEDGGEMDPTVRFAGRTRRPCR